MNAYANSMGRSAICLALVLVVAACDETGIAAPSSGSILGRSLTRGATSMSLNVSVCSPAAGPFSTQSANPYFPIPVGQQWVYSGDEDGVATSLQITVLNQIRSIQSVTTRVIEEREWQDGQLLEVSWNYYAQAPDGTICYFGEDVDIYEASGITHEGAWCASDPGNHAGIFMPADPKPGMKFQMEVAPGIALDEGQIVNIGPYEVPLARFTETIRVREFNPLDRGKGYKIFAFGTGLIVDGPVELTAINQTAGSPGQPLLTLQNCGT
jgi:hypothetical protein